MAWMCTGQPFAASRSTASASSRLASSVTSNGRTPSMSWQPKWTISPMPT